MDNNAEIVKLVNELYDNIYEAIKPVQIKTQIGE